MQPSSLTRAACLRHPHGIGQHAARVQTAATIRSSSPAMSARAQHGAAAVLAPLVGSTSGLAHRSFHSAQPVSLLRPFSCAAHNLTQPPSSPHTTSLNTSMRAHDVADLAGAHISASHPSTARTSRSGQSRSYSIDGANRSEPIGHGARITSTRTTEETLATASNTSSVRLSSTSIGPVGSDHAEWVAATATLTPTERLSSASIDHYTPLDISLGGTSERRTLVSSQPDLLGQTGGRERPPQQGLEKGQAGITGATVAEEGIANEVAPKTVVFRVTQVPRTAARDDIVRFFSGYKVLRGTCAHIHCAVAL